MSKLLWSLTAIWLALAPSSAVQAKGGGSQSSHQATSNSAALLGGNNGNDKKGGRYLASPAKKLPGKRKPPTLTLKRGRHD